MDELKNKSKQELIALLPAGGNDFFEAEQKVINAINKGEDSAREVRSEMSLYAVSLTIGLALYDTIARYSQSPNFDAVASGLFSSEDKEIEKGKTLYLESEYEVKAKKLHEKKLDETSVRNSYRLLSQASFRKKYDKMLRHELSKLILEKGYYQPQVPQFLAATAASAAQELASAPQPTAPAAEGAEYFRKKIKDMMAKIKGELRKNGSKSGQATLFTKNNEAISIEFSERKNGDKYTFSVAFDKKLSVMETIEGQDNRISLWDVAASKPIKFSDKDLDWKNTAGKLREVLSDFDGGFLVFNNAVTKVPQQQMQQQQMQQQQQQQQQQMQQQFQKPAPFQLPILQQPMAAAAQAEPNQALMNELNDVFNKIKLSIFETAKVNSQSLPQDYKLQTKKTNNQPRDIELALKSNADCTIFISRQIEEDKIIILSLDANDPMDPTAKRNTFFVNRSLVKGDDEIRKKLLAPLKIVLDEMQTIKLASPAAQAGAAAGQQLQGGRPSLGGGFFQQ